MDEQLRVIEGRLFSYRLEYAFSILDAYLALSKTYKQMGGDKIFNQLKDIKYRTEAQDKYFVSLKNLKNKIDNLEQELTELCSDERVKEKFMEHYKIKSDITVQKQKIEKRIEDIQSIIEISVRNKDTDNPELIKIIMKLQKKNELDKLKIQLTEKSCEELRNLLY